MNTESSRIYGENIRRSNCDTGVPELEKKESSTEKKKFLSDHKITQVL